MLCLGFEFFTFFFAFLCLWVTFSTRGAASMSMKLSVQTEIQFNPAFQIVAIAVGDELGTIISLQISLNRPIDDYIRYMTLNWALTRSVNTQK